MKVKIPESQDAWKQASPVWRGAVGKGRLTYLAGGLPNQNSTDLLKRIVDREQTALRRAAEAVRRRQVADVLNLTGTVSEPALAPIQETNRKRREEREKARRERFEQVRALYRQGASIKRIAAQLRMHCRDVRRYIRADQLPERATPPKRKSQLDSFLPYLQQRWEEGCHNSAALFREIQTQGYRGSDSLLRHVIRRWKVGLPPEFQARPPINFKVAQTLFTPPSVHKTVWLALDPRIEKTEAVGWFLEELRNQSPLFQTAVDLVLRFQTFIKERESESLGAWLTEAEATDIPEFKTFVLGLRQDLQAVTAALTSEWSNGRVEGAVHRLKLIKRSMFGRAKFPLLRARTIQSEKNQ